MILLIRPHLGGQSDLGVPLSLLYISAMLKKNGFETKILDYTKDTMGVDEAFRRYKPKIVGISVTYTMQEKDAMKIANKLKGKALIIAGGNPVTVDPEHFLNNGFDIAVRGEGENIIVDIANGKNLGSIRGISYKSGGKIIHNKNSETIADMDELPFPDYEAVDLQSYMNPSSRLDLFSNSSRRKISMITSRGCPFGCSFCSIRLHMGKQWRANTSQYVIDHLRLLRRYGIEHVSFEDDNLTFDRKRFEKILDGLKPMKITWDTPNGVRLDTLDRKLLRKMKYAGLTRLTIGIESGSQRVIDEVIHKHINLRDVVKIAKICKEEKIPLSAFYIIGMAGETKKEIEETLSFALDMFKRYDVMPKLSMCAALPGTEMTEKNKAYIKQGRFETEEFTLEEINNYYRGFQRKLILPYITKLNMVSLANNIDKIPKTFLRFLDHRNVLKI